MRILIAALAACTANAELLKIEIGFGGMECASCAEFIESRMTRNRHVQSVHMDKEKGILRLELKAGNALRLDQVRDLVQQSGFTLKSVAVSARATVQPGGAVRIPESGQEFRTRDGKELLKPFVAKLCLLEAGAEPQPDRTFLLEIRRAGPSD
jgi:cation transport ATPase